MTVYIQMSKLQSPEGWGEFLWLTSVAGLSVVKITVINTFSNNQAVKEMTGQGLHIDGLYIVQDCSIYIADAVLH